MNARGLTLFETVVVLFIGIVLLFSLLPAAIGLLRQQQGLTASTLSVETFPLLWERLGRDFSQAAGASLEPPFTSPVFRVVLAPLRSDAPGVTWDFRRETIVRTLVRADSEGRETRKEHSWTIDGRFSLLRDELLYGRWVLRYEPHRGEEEIFAFVPGRPTEPAKAATR